MQDDRMGEDLAFGTRGGTAIHHYFPVDGEYVVRIRLQRNARDYIRGLAEPHELEVRVDGGSIALFQVGGEIRGRNAGIFSRGNLGDPAQEEYERLTADEHLEIRLQAKAGTHVVTAAFLKEISLPEGPLQQRLSQNEYSQYKGGLPAVGSVTIGGPFDTQGCRGTRQADAGSLLASQALMITRKAALGRCFPLWRIELIDGPSRMAM